MKTLTIIMFAVLLGGCSASILVVEPDELHDKSVSITHLDAPHAKAERRFVWVSTLPKYRDSEPDPRFTGEPYDPLKELLR
jgi:hypothetical protein